MNTLSETILLTGGTGQVGMALLPRLLAAPDTRVMALVRARDAEHADLRRREMVESLRLGAAGERLIVGRCFHEAAGDDALTVGDLAEHIAALVGRRPLRFVDQGMYRKYIRPVLKPLLSLHPKGRAIIRGGNAYMPYFMGNPLFDTTELRAALGEAGRAPPILDYLSRVVGYAQARDFGRR